MNTPQGLFRWEHWSKTFGSKSPTSYKARFRKLLAHGRFRNGITTAGLNAIDETNFRGGTVYTSWYAGLIDLTSFSTLAAADTMSSHAGWAELTSYAEATRPQWSPGAAVGGVLTNGTYMTYTFNGASQTVNGAYIVSNSTKGGTSGLLFATGLLTTPQVFVVGEVFRLFYSLTAAAGVGS